jgi:hypothetical protein
LVCLLWIFPPKQVSNSLVHFPTLQSFNILKMFLQILDKIQANFLLKYVGHILNFRSTRNMRPGSISGFFFCWYFLSPKLPPLVSARRTLAPNPAGSSVTDMNRWGAAPVHNIAGIFVKIYISTAKVLWPVSSNNRYWRVCRFSKLRRSFLFVKVAKMGEAWVCQL